MLDADMSLDDIAQCMYTQRMYAYAPDVLLSCVLV